MLPGYDLDRCAPASLRSPLLLTDLVIARSARLVLRFSALNAERIAEDTANARCAVDMSDVMVTVFISLFSMPG
jgi:hypothetical protein